MSKASRYFEVGHHYHLTPRCHGRQYEGSFRLSYRAAMDERVEGGESSRESVWANGLALGSEAYMNSVASRIGNRRSFQREKVSEADGNAWVLKEEPVEYA